MTIDLEGFTAAIEIADQAAGTADQCLNLAKTVGGLFSRSKVSGDAELKATIAQLTAQVADTALTNAKLKAELAVIYNAADKAKQFESELARYELQKTEAGSFIYALKSDDPSGEPGHSICPRCVEDGKKSILQGEGRTSSCQRCGSTFRLKNGQPSQTSTRRRRGRGPMTV